MLTDLETFRMLHFTSVIHLNNEKVSPLTSLQISNKNPILHSLKKIILCKILS